MGASTCHRYSAHAEDTSLTARSYDSDVPEVISASIDRKLGISNEGRPNTGRPSAFFVVTSTG